MKTDTVAQKKAPAKAGVAKTAARKVIKPAKATAPKKEAARKVVKVPPVVAATVAKVIPVGIYGAPIFFFELTMGFWLLLKGLPASGAAPDCVSGSAQGGVV